MKCDVFEDSFSRINVDFLKKLDPDPYLEYSSDSGFRTLAQTFNFKMYLFARGRLERYEELKDGMLEGGVGAQDERQVSW